MTDYAELKKLAEAATPGPWTATTAEWQCDWPECKCKVKGQEECHDGYWDGCPGVDKIYTLEMGDFFAMNNEDAAYVAAANPQTVLELLAENASLKAKLQEAREALAPFADEAGEWDDCEEPLSDKYMPLIGHEQDSKMAKATFCLGDLRRAREVQGGE